MFSRQQALRLSRVLFLLVATITVWACQNPDPKIDKQPKGSEQQAATAHKETPPGATAPTPGTAKTPVSTDKTSALTPPPAGDRLTLAFKPSATAFENAAALKHLAPDTPIVIVATDPQSLLNRLGREALTKKFANYYEKGVAEVAQTIGHNILDPKNLPEVGIDPTAPVGFALVKISRPVGVFFFGLSDADKFKTSLYSVAGRVNEKMEPHVVGDSMVICPRNDEEVCFILKGNIAFVHFADMSDEKALESAMAFAARTADLPSLGTDEGFMATIKALKYGKDAAVYVSMSGLLKGVLGVENGWAKDSLDNAKNQLEKYKKEENQTEVKYWEGRVKDAEEWYEKDIKRQAKQQEMLKALMGGLEGMVMGASLEDRSIKLKSYTELPPDSPWSKIALGVEGISPLVTFLPKTPLYMAHAKVNIEEYLKMLEPIIGAEGISMEQMREMFKVATELDLDQDVLATLSGEIGFAISGDLSRFDDSEKAGFMALDGYTFLGLADSGKMAALMTSLSANPILSDFLRPAGDGKWQVIVPEWKTVDIALLDKYLVASTDPTFIESMRTGKGTSFLDSISNEEVKSILSTPDTLGVALVDFGSFSFWIFAGKHSFDSELAKPEAESTTPYSAAYKAKETELADLKKNVRKMRDDVDKETRVLINQMVSRIGLTAGVARKEGTASVFYGGHFIDDESFPKLIEHMIEDGLALEKLDSTKRSEVWKLQDQKWQMERELQELRDKDIREYHEKKANETDGAPAAQPVLDATNDNKAVQEKVNMEAVSE